MQPSGTEQLGTKLEFKIMADINQMFEAFKIADSDKESFEKFSNNFGDKVGHNNRYEIKTIIVGDTNNSKEDKHA